MLTAHDIDAYVRIRQHTSEACMRTAHNIIEMKMDFGKILNSV
jgi:hypothetical protein